MKFNLTLDGKKIRLINNYLLVFLLMEILNEIYHPNIVIFIDIKKKHK